MTPQGGGGAKSCPREAPGLQESQSPSPCVPTYQPLVPTALHLPGIRETHLEKARCYHLHHSTCPRQGEHTQVGVSPILFQIENDSALSSTIWEIEVTFCREALSTAHQGSPNRRLPFLINKLCTRSLLPELAMSQLIIQLATMDLEIWGSMSCMFHLSCSQDFIISTWLTIIARTSFSYK